MFREKFNRIAVRQGIALREVPHGLNQKLLPINVAGIGGAFASLLSGHIGGTGIVKTFAIGPRPWNQ